MYFSVTTSYMDGSGRERFDNTIEISAKGLLTKADSLSIIFHVDLPGSRYFVFSGEFL